MCLCAVAAPRLSAEEPLPFEELIKLDGKEFAKAAEEASWGFYAEKSPYTVDQLITVAERLIASVKPLGAVRSSDEGENRFGEYFEQACLKANDQQLNKLIEIYARLDHRSFEKAYYLPPLATRCIAREVAAIRRDHCHAELSEPQPSLPPELTTAPPQLQDAWRLFRRATLKYEKAFPDEKNGEKIEAYANLRTFYGMVEATLSGKGKGLQTELRKYADTGPNCLDITDVEDAKDVGLLLILLHERKLDEAIGAALRVTETNRSSGSPEVGLDPVVELLRVSGLDWEMIFAGAQIDREVREWKFHSRRSFLDALGRYGSERTALLVNQLAHFVKPDTRELYVAALDYWIDKSRTVAECNGKGFEIGSEGTERRSKEAIGKTQTKLLRTIEEFATSDCSERLANYANHTFGRTQSASSIPSLQALTHHHSGNVATTAARVLCAMGVETQLPKSTTGVRFRISVNGKALPKGTKVGWGVFSQSNGTSSSVDMKTEGLIEIERDYFTNSDKPATVVWLQSEEEAPEATRFRMRVTPPANLDQITDVSVAASPLEIALRNQQHLNAPPPKKASVKLTWHGSEEDVRIFGILSREGLEVSTEPSVLLPSVQNGVYDVSIRVPGAEVWHAIATVGSEARAVDAFLKPGSDVRFEIVGSDGSHNYQAALLKDNKELDVRPDYETHSYRALPCGSYVLRIAGSESFETYRQNQNLKRGPDEVSFKSRSVAFSVAEGSPALIDLGEIHLEPSGR